jgi:hypothetical protein
MFVFQEEGDKYNRQRLRNFEGFTFQTDSEEYEVKIQWVLLRFKFRGENVLERSRTGSRTPTSGTGRVNSARGGENI